MKLENGVYQSLIEKMGLNKSKKRSGYTMAEITFSLLVIFLMTCIFVSYAYADILSMLKRSRMSDEMAVLRNGCVIYQMLNKAGTAPASLQALVTGLTADSSVDGVEHKEIVKLNNVSYSGSSILDPWGNAYEYSQSARTISCTPYDGDGNSMDKVTFEF